MPETWTNLLPVRSDWSSEEGLPTNCLDHNTGRSPPSMPMIQRLPLIREIQLHHQVKIPEMRPLIQGLVHKLYRREIKDHLIDHLPYPSIIDAVGGENCFTQMALNSIEPRVLALQGKMVTVEMLERICTSQMQEPDPWPHFDGGYCDFITDRRDEGYWRGYVGQASILATRISQHCSAIRTGRNDTLHYHIVTSPSAAGYRYSNFIRLWVIRFPVSTEAATKEAFQNILEMSFTRVFQTLAPSVLEQYFGPCPEGSYSTLGLNIVPPLTQGRELSPRVRGEFTKLLENSSDLEIRGWPGTRAQQKHRPRTSAKILMDTQKRPRLTAEDNILALFNAVQRTRELAKMNMWPSCHKETIPWVPLENNNQPLDLRAWFENTSNRIMGIPCFNNDLAAPVGTTEASVGILMDSVPSHTYGEISLPWGLRESGFTETNSLIWVANFQKYKLVPGSFQVSMTPEAATNLFTEVAQELIARSSLRLILLCGRLAEKLSLTEQDLQNNFTLDLQGVSYECWLRLKNNAIERIFVRSPAPLIKLWSNKGSAAVKISTLFRFVSAVSQIKLSTSFYESALTVALVIRGWDDERSGRINPLSPELEKINLTLRIWLGRSGFQEDDDLRSLSESAGGSLRLGMLILLLIAPRFLGIQGLRKIPQSKFKQRGVIPPDTIQRVRLLKEKIQEGLTSVHQSGGGQVSIASHTSALTEETLLMDGDLMADVLEHDSIATSQSDTEEQIPTIDQQPKKKPEITEINRMAFRKGLQLLIGYHFKGHETRKGEVSTYQFNVQHTTFRVHRAPPNHTLFFLRAEIAPIGERHPQAYATEASENDPGIRFGFRVSLRDNEGEESFVGYANSSTWQAIAIANSFVDGLDGDSFEEICRRKRRFVYVDKRLKNVSPELQLFMNGAYRDDQNNVVRYNSAFPKESKPTEQTC
ncbi:unnamed protein product [Penicillium olsonii]|nr:unnamed protein product [Penicillium olsonii]